MQLFHILVDEGVHDAVTVVRALCHQLGKLDAFHRRVLLQPFLQVGDTAASLDYNLILLDLEGADLRAQ